jgi:hypothetical protein
MYTLLKSIRYVIALFVVSFSVDAATLDIVPGVVPLPMPVVLAAPPLIPPMGATRYTWGGANGWIVTGGAGILGVRLTAQELHNHLVASWDMALQELSRLLLAQGAPAAPGVHNIPGNYTLSFYAVGQAVHDVAQSLKVHMLKHGHLGYFPEFNYNSEGSPTVANNRTPRGIFNIPFQVASRICRNQKERIRNRFNFYINDEEYLAGSSATYPNRYRITDDVHHLLPNIESAELFAIDPWVPRPTAAGATPAQRPNLADVADGLIDFLLTAGPNVPAGGLAAPIRPTAINIRPHVGSRFTIQVTYPAPPAPPALPAPLMLNLVPITEDENIGYRRDGSRTQVVLIVVQVTGGVISIVSMFPDG